MPTFHRLALPALLGASLGCPQPTPTAGDAGSRAAEAAERRLDRPSTPTTAAAAASLNGRVLWHGPPPLLPALATTASVQSVCGASVADNAFRVDGAGGVADVVVWVDAPAEPSPVAQPGPTVVLDQRRCLYWPPVLAARAGGSLHIRNSDPLTHTVHGFAAGQTVFNVAMPLEHMELQRPLPQEPQVLDVRCDVHPWMHAVVRTFAHSHFTTTGTDGRFQLGGLAPGEAVVHVWHPRLGEASRRVQVGAAGAGVDFDFGGKP